jgi:hypothetical protein
MWTNMNRLVLLLLTLASFTLFSGFTCGPPVNQDTGFDMWCGNDLCAWEVPEGAIRRVPTWHRSDYGVSLEGERVTLTQLVVTNAGQGRCFRADMQVDRDGSVQLRFAVDFDDDGTPELDQPVTGSRFVPAVFPVVTTAWFDSVRFTITKIGTGRAVLARVRIDRDDCPEIELTDRPEGAACDSPEQCKTGLCHPVPQWREDIGDHLVDACSSCEDGDCSAGEVCDIAASPNGMLYQGCSETGQLELGNRCLHAEACASGVCCQGVCSQCCHDADCPHAEACRTRDWRTLGDDYEFQMLPWQCAPGAGEGVTGAPCLLDDDCASGACRGEGELSHCFLDGRICQQDEDCPIWNACLTVGVAGGSCL